MSQDCFKTRKEKVNVKSVIKKLYYNWHLEEHMKHHHREKCNGCPGLDLATLHNTHLIEPPLQYLC